MIFGTKAEVVALLGKSTAYIERSNLTSRLFNGRQVRKTLAFSKTIQAYRAMAAELTDHIWTVKELLMTLPLPGSINT